MMKNIYKVFMAIFDNKIICSERFFIITYDIRTSKYIIWYINEFKIPRIFDCCEDKDVLQFKWNILMNKGGSL